MDDIQSNDGCCRPSWSDPSWHRKERVVEGEITSKSQIAEVAYPVILQDFPVPKGYSLASDACTHMIVGMRPDERIIIATCSKEYKVFGNDEIFDKAMEALKGTGARLSFAVTMGGGKKVSYSFELPAAGFKGAYADEYRMMINVVSSHDKTLGCRVFGSSTRIVCANTLQMALQGKKELVNHTMFHTAKGQNDFRCLPQRLEGLIVLGKAFKELTEQMGNFSMNKDDARAIAAFVLATEADGKFDPTDVISTQVYNNALGIADKFERGLGNKGSTFYDLLNGVTEWFTSGDGSGKRVSLFEKAISADYGNAAEKKVEFLTRFQTPTGDLIPEKQVIAMINRGKRMIKDYKEKKEKDKAAE